MALAMRKFFISLKTGIQWTFAFVTACLFAILACVEGVIDSKRRLPHITNRFYFRAILPWLGIHLVVRGAQHVDRKRNYIICANHQGLFDIFCLAAGLPLVFRFVSRAAFFRLPIIGWGMRMSGYVSITRADRDKDSKTIEEIKGRLQRGESFLFFPEGTRTRDGNIGPFRLGAFKAAHQTGIPILPVTIRGSFERMRKGSYQVVPGTIELTIGKPISSQGEDPSSLLERTRNVITGFVVTGDRTSWSLTRPEKRH